ncbi:putative sensor domain DACNV-containing protein [Corallococcus llansteffanensis]|nr:diadenylate cyclase [Corallococcus llansteffanensis]
MSNQGNHFKYPADVMGAFLKQEAKASLPTGGLLAQLHDKVLREPHPTPPMPVFVRLIETMFFASMATEEGHLNPLGIVFTEVLGVFQEKRPAWDFVSITPAVPFEVGSLAKLASLCEFPRTFLVVTTRSEALVVVGLATPHSRQFLDVDPLIRVLVPKPGVVAVCRGEREIIRYERGTLRGIPPPPIRGKHRPQLDSIEKVVLEEFAEPPLLDARNFFLRIVLGMVRLGHGGLLAILAPGEDPVRFIEQAKRLDPPLALGPAISGSLEAQLIAHDSDQHRFSIEGNQIKERPAPPDELEDYRQVLEANQRVERLIAQIARLTSVDGAVILSHDLHVLAFGAKLTAQNPSPPQVYAVTSELEMNELWPLQSHGTRHRAAAAFAAELPERLAIIVSQDGDAATLQQLDGKVVYWPLGTPVSDPMP